MFNWFKRKQNNEVSIKFTYKDIKNIKCEVYWPEDKNELEKNLNVLGNFINIITTGKLYSYIVDGIIKQGKNSGNIEGSMALIQFLYEFQNQNGNKNSDNELVISPTEVFDIRRIVPQNES